MSTYAIGDLQGCYNEFQALLEKINFDRHTDRLWLLGDLVNRGPDNLGIVRQLRELGDAAVCILGNHDLHFLAVATGQHKTMRADTLEDLLAAPELDDLIEWMRHLPLLYRDTDLGFTMVHAGLPPCWDVDTCFARAAEVEQTLQGDDYTTFLTSMYGNFPSSWDNRLEGMDRLRLITNYFTRLRYCKADGTLELQHKTDIAPDGFAPWFEHLQPHHACTKILFGHWAAIMGQCSAPDCFALDTGCVWGRSLTAMRLEDCQRYTVDAGGP